MKLSRLYSNKPELFEPVDFVAGLNVVMAEIRLPENRDKDTHNLGKTTLGRLLDFGFLAGRDPKFFLFKHLDLFKDFVFFLEIELQDASYVTVRRSVEEASKMSSRSIRLAIRTSRLYRCQNGIIRTCRLIAHAICSMACWICARSSLGLSARVLATCCDHKTISAMCCPICVSSRLRMPTGSRSSLISWASMPPSIVQHYDKEAELTQKQAPRTDHQG